MGETKTYRVIRLLVENYKKLQAVDVTPDRNAVIVRGKNRQGKTSLLDSIAAVLGGKKHVAEQPIRAGADSGQILCVLGDDKPELLVKRIFTAGGKTAVEITSADGFAAPTPQAILDSLCHHIAFDPLAFLSLDDDAQVEMLRKLVGLDCSELDIARKRLYDERTSTNKRAKSIAAQVASIVVAPATPPEPISVADLVVEQQRRDKHNRTNQAERDRLKQMTYEVAVAKARANAVEREIDDLESRLETARSNLEVASGSFSQTSLLRDAQQATVAAMEDQDVASIQGQIVGAHAINTAVAAAQHRSQLQREGGETEKLAKKLTVDIDAIDAQKAEALAAVQWPIPGLAFGDSGVSYNGLPFSQASGFEQIEVSFAMVASAHPKLRVALIRNASLVDADGMEAIRKMAEKYDMQVWLEVVGDGPSGILIEDGSVVSGGSPPEAAKPIARPAPTPIRPVAPLPNQIDLPFGE